MSASASRTPGVGPQRRKLALLCALLLSLGGCEEVSSSGGADPDPSALDGRVADGDEGSDVAGAPNDASPDSRGPDSQAPDGLAPDGLAPDAWVSDADGQGDPDGQVDGAAADAGAAPDGGVPDGGAGDVGAGDVGAGDVGAGDVGENDATLGDGAPTQGDGGASLDAASPDGAAPDAAAPDASDVGDAGGPLPLAAVAQCDAGDAAWVVRALGFLQARRPHGQAEVQALTQLVAKVGRPAVADAMMKGPLFRERWANWLTEELRVARAGSRANRPCFGDTTGSGANSDLAAWLRKSDPATSTWSATFNMADVLYSALHLDDISVVYETLLFARLSRPATRCDNPAIKEVEQAIRRAFATTFREVYLHRGSACMGCHNSKFSTTDGPTPDTDRFWPLPGRFEKALFGKDAGLPEDVLDGAHRYYGFAEGGFCPQPAYCSVIQGTKLSPWGIDDACAVVAAPAAVGKDTYGPPSYWVAPLADTGSTWELFASMRKGLTGLRQGKKPTLAPGTGALDGHEAFAYLWAVRVAHQVWYEAHGSGLTLTHFFPRNADQRDILESLTNTFIAKKLSFRALLAAVALHPLFNLVAPQDACDPKHAYVLPRVFNPFSKSDPDPAARHNSPGDGVARWPARVLIASIDELMGWPTATRMPTPDEAQLTAALGVRNNTDRPGFRGTGLFELAAWEDRYGQCAAPAPPEPQQVGSMTSLIAGSCQKRCNVNDLSFGLCACDSGCKNRKDCCKDFQSACGWFFKAKPPQPPPPDWIDALVAVAKPSTSLRTLVQTLKDRVVLSAALTPAEEALIAQLFEVPHLSVTVGQAKVVESRLRLFCGVLLRSPAVTLAGVPRLSKPGVPGPQAAVLPVQGEGPQSFCSLWATAALPKGAVWTCSQGKLTLGATP